MEKIIKIDNLTFSYMRESDQRLVEAVKGLDLEIEKGSFLAVIGKNGSGKSTLAKNINALLLPTGGAVYVKGWDTKADDHLWDVRQTVGMIFQNPDNQLVSSIVEDDVAFGPENLGVPPEEIRQRVDEALKAVNMYQHRKKAPHLLSGGQKQRIAIAGVVAMRPDCIIFDEPTAMLDPKGRREVMDIIRKLHQEGITVLLITHFMEEAANADRVLIMDKGQRILDGTPVEIFSEIETIRELGLDVPTAVDMADRLRKRGIPVPSHIIRSEEMVEYLCQYK
ncbi:energy-coupling factor transporter ATPase [Aminipila butyrica]|uniref:ABC transporter ATP-binding protein n=1 Tax=Aminipila butyrica TaxID=433296 RepID=A0A858BTN6_9FIRM|nr:energy-coupling factor transporter ATPase [Aminipila butyrica]QIB68455.1 energy-coupling factor transporter ATPase [Aminipila butyrica]